MIGRFIGLLGRVTRAKRVMCRGVLIGSSLATGAFAYEGWYLLHYYPEKITSDIVALIAIFATSGGWTIYDYNKRRKHDDRPDSFNDS